MTLSISSPPVRHSLRATVIEPIGDLTLELSRRVYETAQDVRRYGGFVIISMRGIANVSWGALCELAAELLSDPTNQTDVRFSDIVPRVRALMREVGLGRHWIVDRARISTERRIVIPV